MPQRYSSKWLGLLGIELSPVSHAERIVSALGGFAGILAILEISQHFVGIAAATLIVASMGASAVLLFAVPHGPLSQPWPLIGGHLLSAVIGVSCGMLIPDQLVAAALAVALAIGVMHYARCIHPPGGATALSAVIGGPAVHALGYQFVVTPVLLNVLVILAVAVLFNYPFAWRRYPVYLKRTRATPAGPVTGAIAHEDLVYALSEMDSFIDVSEQDLIAIYDIATRRSQESHLPPEALQLGHYYSNGKYGAEWSVRQIVDQSGSGDDSQGSVIFKVLAGAGRRSSGVATREQFARWARHEVYRDDENWRRVQQKSP
jgi:CBS domain-containing membrane protein